MMAARTARGNDLAIDDNDQVAGAHHDEEHGERARIEGRSKLGERSDQPSWEGAPAERDNRGGSARGTQHDRARGRHQPHERQDAAGPAVEDAGDQVGRLRPVCSSGWPWQFAAHPER